MSFPARLHVLLAGHSSAAVVIRRGPSDRVCTIGWDRKTDTFELGQWLHGRIYERRSDLSPDGKHLIYFALNAQWDSDTGGSWTAISRASWPTSNSTPRGQGLLLGRARPGPLRTRGEHRRTRLGMGGA